MGEDPKGEDLHFSVWKLMMGMKRGPPYEASELVMPKSSVILLVDDNPDDALLMQCAFTEAGFEKPLIVVQDGLEAMSYLEGTGRYANRAAHPLPELLLLDLNLPRMDGLELLRWARKEPRFERLPIVIVTGSNDEKLIARAHKLGANAHLVKPVSFKDLVQAIRRQGGLWMPRAQLARAVG